MFWEKLNLHFAKCMVCCVTGMEVTLLCGNLHPSFQY